MNNKYELDVVHPAVAQWLTKHGYTYQHEVVMPEYGRADFVATHNDGHTLIVECKRDSRGLARVITQVSDYRRQYQQTAKIAVAIPISAITPVVKQVCERRNAILIGVDVPSKPQQPEAQYNHALDDVIVRLLKRQDEWGALRDDLTALMVCSHAPSAQNFVNAVLKLVAANIERAYSDPDLLQPDRWSDIVGGAK